MPQRIHIFGASGSGTSTLGQILAKAIGGVHLDTDTYYWHKTNPPFTDKREPAERIALIEKEGALANDWVLSGSICSWGDPLLHHFTLAVFLQLDVDVRMARLVERERRRYGDRIDVGGDMRELHEKFMTWARSYDSARVPIRSLDMHEQWLRRLRCPVLTLDSVLTSDVLCRRVLAHIKTEPAHVGGDV